MSAREGDGCAAHRRARRLARHQARRMATASVLDAPGVARARRTARRTARGGRATRIRRRATSASDDETARATRDATTRMSYDDGEPLIDARSARVKRTGRKSAAPPVTRPGILKSKAAALREIDEATAKAKAGKAAKATKAKAEVVVRGVPPRWTRGRRESRRAARRRGKVGGGRRRGGARRRTLPTPGGSRAGRARR